MDRVVDKAERFGVNLPAKPEVREIPYTSWRGAMLPARVYTVKDGPKRYSVTVVNYQKITDTAYLRKIGTHDLLRNP